MKRNTDLQKALDGLADLYKYGHLQASSTPVDFINMVADDIKRLRGAEQNPSANTGSVDGSLSGERDVLNFGWLKTKYIKKALFAMIKNERRHVDLCRRTYKTEYMYELDDRLSDLTTIENMVGEI